MIFVFGDSFIYETGLPLRVMKSTRPSIRIAPIFPVALLLATAATIGTCGLVSATPQASPKAAPDAQAYANAHKGLMQEYSAKMVQLSSRPLPPKSLPKKQWRAAMASQINDLAIATAGFARRMDTLKPPATLQTTHAATRAFFEVSASANYHLAAMIRGGDRKAVSRAVADAAQAEGQSMQRISDAFQKAGGDASVLRQTIQTLTTSTAAP